MNIETIFIIKLVVKLFVKICHFHSYVFVPIENYTEVHEVHNPYACNNANSN